MDTVILTYLSFLAAPLINFDTNDPGLKTVEQQ